MREMPLGEFILKFVVRALEKKDIIAWTERRAVEEFIYENPNTPLTEELLEKMLRELS